MKSNRNPVLSIGKKKYRVKKIRGKRQKKKIDQYTYIIKEATFHAEMDLGK